MTIFTIWGGIAFQEEGSIIKGWDGKLNGIMGPNGNYYYLIIATSFYGDEVEYKGAFII